MERTLLRTGLLLLAAGIINLSMFSCSSGSDEGKNVTVTPSKTSVEIGETVTFTVLSGNDDVTSRATIVNNRDGDAVLNNASFTPSAAGNYNFTATYQGKSATTTVTVTKASGGGSLYYRKVAVLYFTTDWCQNCPPERRILTELVSSMVDRVEVIAIHGQENWVNLDIPEGLKLIETYNPERYYPFSYYDLRKSTIGSSLPILKSYVNQSIDNYPAQAGIAIETSRSDRTVNVKVKVKAELENDFSLFVTLLEDGIIGRQEDRTVSGGTVMNYSHDNTLRDIKPSAAGEKLGVIRAGQEVVKDYTFTLGAEVNPEKAYITAYITINDRDGYINNANSCPIGKSVDYLYNK